MFELLTEKQYLTNNIRRIIFEYEQILEFKYLQNERACFDVMSRSCPICDYYRNDFKCPDYCVLGNDKDCIYMHTKPSNFNDFKQLGIRLRFWRKVLKYVLRMSEKNCKDFELVRFGIKLIDKLHNEPSTIRKA